MKSVYVKNEDLPVWENAQKAHGKSLSSLITQLLRKYTEERMPVAEVNAAGMKKITVVTCDSEELQRIKHSFTGKWLIDENHAVAPIDDGDGILRGHKTRYALAQTQKGALVVYEFSVDDDPASMEVYDSFEDIQAADIDNRYPLYPENVLASFASALGEEFVIEHDI